MLVVSSKQTKDDFTAKRIRQSQNEPTVFVRDYAVWHVKEGVFSENKFAVLVGNDQIPSKILDPEEVGIIRSKLKDGMLIPQFPFPERKSSAQVLAKSLMEVRIYR